MSWPQLSIINRNTLFGCHPSHPSTHSFSAHKPYDDLLLVAIQAGSGAGMRRAILAQLFRQVARIDLCYRAAVIEYIWGKYRRNCRPTTLRNICSCLLPFTRFVKRCGKDDVKQIGRRDIEAYVEYEQDRGLQPITIDGRLKCIYGFLRQQAAAGTVDPQLLVRKIRIKVPERLPRAMDPLDAKQLLAVIGHVRDRALILVLLRTGMRIGELLRTQAVDVNLGERKILIFEGEKNFKGRAALLSDDAYRALKRWMQTRSRQKHYLFYGRSNHRLSYSRARALFRDYLDKAGLSAKGYSLHCLRHSFATDLLNAGMRIECVQQLLGHSSLQMTLRYARLSDKTREDEYFRAMAIIEGEHCDEANRCDRQLPALLEASQLLGAHG